VERGLDAGDVVDRQIHRVGPLVFVAEALYRLRHHGVIDDRQHLHEMVLQELVVEHLVAVVQRRQEGVARQIVCLPPVLLIRAARLLLQ